MKNKSKRFFCSGLGIVLIAGLLVVCGGGIFALSRVLPDLWPGVAGRSTSVPIPIDSGSSIETGATSTETATEQQMRVRLSEGQAQPYTAQTLGETVGEPMTEEEIEAIFARLPTLPASEEDQSDFKLAGDPIPPPRTGETIEQTFPAEESAIPPETEETGPLEVLRYSPEGEIPLAPFLSVTFNQPMVPLGTLEDLAALDVPVQIEPALEGTWRWLGTKKD